MLRRPGRGHLFGRVFAQTVLTALTFAVSKGTDRDMEDEMALTSTHFPAPFPRILCRRGRKGALGAVGCHLGVGRSPTRTCWPAHEARRAPSAASCLRGEEFIVIVVLVMACGLILPGGVA